MKSNMWQASQLTLCPCYRRLFRQVLYRRDKLQNSVFVFSLTTRILYQIDLSTSAETPIFKRF